MYPYISYLSVNVYQTSFIYTLQCKNDCVRFGVVEVIHLPVTDEHLNANAKSG